MSANYLNRNIFSGLKINIPSVQFPFIMVYLPIALKTYSILRKSMNMRASFENLRIFIFYKTAITFDSLLVIQQKWSLGNIYF